jgi:hypothetical protein
MGLKCMFMWTFAVLMCTSAWASAVGAPQCACFSLCDRASATDFISRMPGQVTSPASPWVGYLKAVYRGDVVLPFHLGAVSFLYLGSSAWRAMHLTTHWPVPACHHKDSKKGGAWDQGVLNATWRSLCS